MRHVATNVARSVVCTLSTRSFGDTLADRQTDTLAILLRCPIHRVKRRHIVDGHDTIAILWV